MYGPKFILALHSITTFPNLWFDYNLIPSFIAALFWSLTCGVGCILIHNILIGCNCDMIFARPDNNTTCCDDRTRILNSDITNFNQSIQVIEPISIYIVEAYQ